MTNIYEAVQLTRVVKFLGSLDVEVLYSLADVHTAGTVSCLFGANTKFSTKSPEFDW